MLLPIQCWLRCQEDASSCLAKNQTVIRMMTTGQPVALQPNIIGAEQAIWRICQEPDDWISDSMGPENRCAPLSAQLSLGGFRCRLRGQPHEHQRILLKFKIRTQLLQPIPRDDEDRERRHSERRFWAERKFSRDGERSCVRKLANPVHSSQRFEIPKCVQKQFPSKLTPKE